MNSELKPESVSKLLLWIDEQSRRCHRKAAQARFFALSLKAIQITMAGALPILALAAPSASSPSTNGIIGAVIVTIEGFQHSFKFEQFWVMYRQAGSGLQDERRLYELRAGPYENVTNADAVLAKRVTNLTQQRVTGWAATVQKALAKSS